MKRTRKVDPREKKRNQTASNTETNRSGPKRCVMVHTDDVCKKHFTCYGVKCSPMSCPMNGSEAPEFKYTPEAAEVACTIEFRGSRRKRFSCYKNKRCSTEMCNVYAGKRMNGKRWPKEIDQ